MATEYCLFLDETCANAQLPAFCLAGCIIEKAVYEHDAIPAINSLKQNVFGSDNVILHEMELRKVNLSVHPEYSPMLDANKRDEFWQGLGKIFASGMLTVMGTVVKVNECYSYYPEMGRMGHSSISLQLILENFVHFLEKHDGVGSLFLEARGPGQDDKIQERFYLLKAIGTLFLSSSCIQKRIGTISFPLKKDNVAGLQLADFCPNPIARNSVGLSTKSPSVLGHLLASQYDGGVNRAERFGIKVL